MMPKMRTTVTLEADTEHLLREAVRTTNRSFKQVLNEAIRRGLTSQEGVPTRVEPLFKHPFPRELSGVSFNRVADELDDEITLQELDR